ncbi:MAG: hypothetical protein ABEJ31_06045 [Haloarculaceae archaeon]
MQRRQVLLGLLVALVAVTAGCATTPQPQLSPPGSGGFDDVTPTPTPMPLRSPSWDFGPGSDGNLTVTVTVKNPSDHAVDARVVAAVTNLDAEYAGSEPVTVGPRSEIERNVTVPIGYDKWLTDGGNIRIRFEQPSTTAA